MEKDVAYYMGLSYPVEIQKVKEADGGGYFVSVPMLTGCMSDGETIDEAYSNIEEAKEEWFASMLERNMEIPEPDEKEEYSGRFVVRLPRSLHKLLVQASKREGVSLNQFVTSSLAYSMGQKI
ncbi:MAG: type II toxin-antitoxin system HicB family antitoxin [Anaerovibrio sp.]